MMVMVVCSDVFMDDGVLVICRFFFFKQKTAYEMRISDWSSDVCSSDLKGRFAQMHLNPAANAICILNALLCILHACGSLGICVHMASYGENILRALPQRRICRKD